MSQTFSITINVNINDNIRIEYINNKLTVQTLCNEPLIQQQIEEPLIQQQIEEPLIQQQIEEPVQQKQINEFVEVDQRSILTELREKTPKIVTKIVHCEINGMNHCINGNPISIKSVLMHIYNYIIINNGIEDMVKHSKFIVNNAFGDFQVNKSGKKGKKEKSGREYISEYNFTIFYNKTTDKYIKEISNLKQYFDIPCVIKFKVNNEIIEV
jgi:hypothetical protein